MTKIFIWVCAAIHVAAMIGEAFFWKQIAPGAAFGVRDDATLKAKEHAEMLAEATVVLGQNQGLYNGFLAAGLIAGFYIAQPSGRHLQIFCLVCIAIAGVVAYLTLGNWLITLIQTVPALAALGLLIRERPA